MDEEEKGKVMDQITKLSYQDKVWLYLENMVNPQDLEENVEQYYLTEGLEILEDDIKRLERSR